MMHLHTVQGHGNKRTRYDPGSAADIDGNGVIEADETEAVIARRIAQDLDDVMAAHGWTVHSYPDGDYTARNRQVRAVIAAHPNERHVVAYLHTDASVDINVRHALINRDPRSAYGARFAPLMVNAWDQYLPGQIRGGKRTRLLACSQNDPQRWKRNCAAVVAPVYRFPGRSFGLLLEVFVVSALTGMGEHVLDQWIAHSVQATCTGLLRIGEAWV